MIVTFFGSPGSGKGTQAELAAEAVGLATSPPAALPREIREDTALGREIREVIEGGNLVPDRLVNRIVFDLLDGLPGVLLDGYPRNVFQARSLDAFLEKQGRRLDLAVFLDVRKPKPWGVWRAENTAPRAEPRRLRRTKPAEPAVRGWCEETTTIRRSSTGVSWSTTDRPDLWKGITMTGW
jgi:adenylate kinase